MMQVGLVTLLQLAIASPAILAGAGLVIRSRTQALGALLIVFGVHMILNMVEETGALGGDLLITPALSLLYGPLIYVFIRGLIFKQGTLALGDGWHVLPAVAALAVMDHLALVRTATLLSLAGYGGVSAFLVWRFHRAVGAIRSDALALRLHWVTGVFIGFAGLTVLDIARVFLARQISPALDAAAYPVTLVSVAGLFATLTYFAIHRPAYFDGLTDTEFKFTPPPNPASVKTEAFQHLHDKIRQEAYFRQPHLTLFDLANLTDLAERDLSRLINQGSGRQFCDYINAHRVDAVKKRLADSGADKAPLLDLAFDAGFASKSTFNAAFKKETGLTPSAYRQNHAAEHRKGPDS